MPTYTVEYAGREGLVPGMDARAVRLALMIGDAEYVQFFRVLISGPELLGHGLGSLDDRQWRAFALAGGLAIEAAVRSGLAESSKPTEAKTFDLSVADLDAALPGADEALSFDPTDEGFGSRPIVHTFTI